MCILNKQPSPADRKRRMSSVFGHVKRPEPPAPALQMTNIQLSDSARHLVGAYTARAYVDMAGSAINDSLYPLDIGLPHPVGSSVRVRYLYSKGNALSADIAFRHEFAPPY